jgi:hypothetical protein
MKKKVIVFFLLLIVQFLPAQTAKYALLDAKSPLLGDWEWISNDTGSAASPIPSQIWMYLHFEAGTGQSFGAAQSDDLKGYGCICYFLAFSNGQTVSTSLSSSCMVTDKGKKFTFEYEYDGSMDQLILTVRGEKSYYQRKKRGN